MELEKMKKITNYKIQITMSKITNKEVSLGQVLNACGEKKEAEKREARKLGNFPYDFILPTHGAELMRKDTSLWDRISSPGDRKSSLRDTISSLEDR